MEADYLTGLLNRIFHYVVGLSENDLPPEVDRAHRAPRPRPNPEDPPRNIIVRLLRWGDKQKILASAKKKKSLFWAGQLFYIQQDLSAEVRRQRAEYNEIIEELKTQKLRVGILHPAQLVVTIEGEKLVYNTPESARKELQKWLHPPDKRTYGFHTVSC